MTIFKQGKDKKKEPVNAEIVISGPSSNSFQHKSHLGITEQGFEVKNLPPEWKELFDGLDSTLKQMGLKGITKKEAEFLLKAAAQHLPGLSTEARNALASIDNKDNKADKHEIVHIQGQTQSLTLNDDKETIFTRYKMLEEENKILKSEIQALKEEITKAFKTIHSINPGATTSVKSQPTAPQPLVDPNHPPVPPRDGPQNPPNHPPTPPRDGPPQPPHEPPKAPSIPKIPPQLPSTPSLNVSAKPAPSSTNNALLDQIHKGKQLKPTEIQPKNNKGGDGDILNILAKVIIERRKATEGTDEEEDDDMWD